MPDTTSLKSLVCRALGSGGRLRTIALKPSTQRAHNSARASLRSLGALGKLSPLQGRRRLNREGFAASSAPSNRLCRLLFGYGGGPRL